MADEVRLIDAEILKKYCLIEGDGDDEFTEGYNAAIVDVRGYVDNMPTIEAEPVDGWISVDDRLPELETWVMVYIKYPSPVFEIERGIIKTSSIKKVFYDGKSFYCDFGTVTHWQPLPEPPKEDKDG